MTLNNGEAKGLKQVLEERGFDVTGLHAKCLPICSSDSTSCCMAHLLSQQDDFQNQESMLKILIKEAGYFCIFLPKFHCELYPIEMVHNITCIFINTGLIHYSIGAGPNIITENMSKTILQKQRT